MKALFISEDYLKENTPIADNIDDKLLKSAIVDAQELHIMEAIGSQLYNDLGTKYLSNTLSTLETDFIKMYLRPTLKHWVVYEVMPYLLFKLTNKSVSTSTGENSSPTDVSNMHFLRKEAKSKAEVYGERMIRYLLAHITSFPLFYPVSSQLDTIYPENTHFTTDFYLGDHGIDYPQPNYGDVR